MSTADIGALIASQPRTGLWRDTAARTDPEFFYDLAVGLPCKLTIVSEFQETGYSYGRGLEIVGTPAPLQCGTVLRAGRTGITSEGVLCYGPSQPFRLDCGGTGLWFSAQQVVYANDLQLTSVACQTTPATSATSPTNDSFAVKQFDAVFRRATEERFEDGMESEFSQELESLVRSYGLSSKGILSLLLADESVSPRVWGEAMRSLGRMDDPTSREARLWILENGLIARSAVIRDGAVLGLASMNDSNAIPYLEKAVRSEKLSGLRADMQEVLVQLTSQ